jgi:hypothetical protein
MLAAVGTPNSQIPKTAMNSLRNTWMRIVLGALMLAMYSPPLGGQTDPSSSKLPAQGATEQHDGQHDFDFQIGAGRFTWSVCSIPWSGGKRGRNLTVCR